MLTPKRESIKKHMPTVLVSINHIYLPLLLSRWLSLRQYQFYSTRTLSKLEKNSHCCGLDSLISVKPLTSLKPAIRKPATICNATHGLKLLSLKSLFCHSIRNPILNALNHYAYQSALEIDQLTKWSLVSCSPFFPTIVYCLYSASSNHPPLKSSFVNQ